MAASYSGDVLRLLKAAGWYKVSGGKGSHTKLRHPDKPGAQTVPKAIGDRTFANDILQQAGLPKAF